jgi:hypothetical protein
MPKHLPSRRYWFRPAGDGRSTTIIQLDNQAGAHDDYLLVAGLQLGLVLPERGSREDKLKEMRWQAMQQGWCRIGVIQLEGSPVSAYVNATAREGLLRAARFADAELGGRLAKLELQLERAQETRDVVILTERSLDRYLIHGALTVEFMAEEDFAPGQLMSLAAPGRAPTR